jgi:TM2 domain-containing membrane protein YozV
MTTTHATKQCPYCAETIHRDAKKCKHCGEFLDGHRPKSGTHHAWSPGVAAVLSFFVPGLGQMYKGSILAGFSFLIFTTIGYLLFIVPGLCFHIWAILDAYNTIPTRYVPKKDGDA